MPLPRARVCLTFDFDAISPWLVASKGGAVAPGVVSRGEYSARVGTRRVLALLEKHGIQATWFIPGHTIDTFPERCGEVVAAGHEVAHHGYCHESPDRLSDAAEREVLELGIDRIKRLTGAAPVGYRAPGGASSQRTMPVLVEYGFRYDSSLAASDYLPYWPRVGDDADHRSGYRFGQEVDVVEIPTQWNMEDWTYYEYAPGFSNGGRAPSHVYRAWTGEFDFMYERIPGGVCVLTLHPESVGRGPRLLVLEQFIQHVRRHPDVEFRLMRDVADEFRAEQAAVGGAR